MAVEKEKTVTLLEPSVPVEQTEEREIDLVELFYRLLDNLKYIILAVIVGALLMGLYTRFMVTPMYESVAKLYVLNSSDSVLNLSDLQVGSSLANDYQEVFNTWEVTEQVITNLGLDYSYASMNNMLTITNPTDTRILNITVQSPDPTEAALIANEYASVARKYISNVMQTDMPSVLSDALASAQPVSPSYPRNIVLGALLGFVLAVGIITVIFIMDDKIKTSSDITKITGLPVLAVVPLVPPTVEEQNDKSKRKKGEKK